MTEETLLRLLAFVHPLWMLASLGAGLWTARLGLEIRRCRRAGQAVGGALRRRHLGWGKRALFALGIGFAMGPLSMIFLRGFAAFESFHSILGVIGIGLFAWTGWSGRALAHGHREAREIHRIAAAASLLTGLLAAGAGFTLLP